MQWFNFAMAFTVAPAYMICIYPNCSGLSRDTRETHENYREAVASYARHVTP